MLEFNNPIPVIVENKNMTANWAKLNKEFDDLFDSLTDEEISQWYEVKESSKTLRREVLRVSGQLCNLALRINEHSNFHYTIEASVHTNTLKWNI